MSEKYNKYITNGYHLEKNIFDKKEVDEILIMIEKFTERNKEKMKIYDINYTPEGKINTIHCLHKFEKTFFEYFNNNTKLKNICKDLLNEEDIEVTGIEAFLKPAGVGMESPIHQDNYLWCLEKPNALTCWVALDEIDGNNGGLKLYPGSHKLGLLNHIPSYKLGTSQTIDEKEYDKFGINSYINNKLSPGDVQFHHSEMIHGSNENKTNNSRRVITFQVKPQNSMRDPTKYKKYRESLFKQQNKLKK